MRNTHARFSRACAGLAFAATAALLFPASSLAQVGPGGAFPGHWRGGGFGGFGHGGSKVVTGEPYSATAVTSTEQTLTDGTHITHQNTATIARDSEGRVMHSETLTSGRESGATIVSIFDPVANQRIEYNSSTKVAHIFVLPPKPSSSGAASASDTSSPHNGRFHSNSVNVTSESLGTQTMAGLTAQGTKTTRTVAAGAFGNDKPLVSTDEKWVSSDLQIVLQSTRSDPRDGQTTYTVSNLQRSEPSASLFQVPAGYQSKTITVPPHPAPE